LPCAVPRNSSLRGTAPIGSEVRWILEQRSAELPDFSVLNITNCLAGTANTSFDLRPGGRIGNISGASGIALTTGFIHSPSMAVVAWEASS